MKKHALGSFTKGWFIGDFEPNLARTKDFEMAIKAYAKGDREKRHYHKIATEYTAAVSGLFKMNDTLLSPGEIVEIAPGEAVAFECIEEGETVVAKIPSVKGDKYEVDDKNENKELHIVVPMAGMGKSFAQAGYTFPKPLIDIGGKPMIQWVIENVKPACPHKFIFICLKEHYDKYSLGDLFANSVGPNFEVVQLTQGTVGAACTVLTAVDFINNNHDLMIVNSDQFIDADINEFVAYSRKSGADGTIVTFDSSHPRWSYVKTDKNGEAVETAEKKVISQHATSGIYYFKTGKQFVDGAFTMIEKHVHQNNEFYVCPVYNELIMAGQRIKIWEIERTKMHGMGTIEDLMQFINYIERQKTA